MTCTNPTILQNNAIFACGKCELCRAKRAQEWKVRATHELITQKKAIFITLTYRPKNLPKVDKSKFIPMCHEDKGGNLNPRDVSLFIKRLRKYLGSEQPIKYIYCGEYGGLRKRPHYHMIIYGINYSPELAQKVQDLWGLGYVDVDKNKITTHAIQYVLGYVRKKINDIQDDAVYNKIGRLRPYQRQSQGIGKDWAVKNAQTWAATGTVCIEQYQNPIPRYYVKTILKKEGETVKYTCTSRYIFPENAIDIKKNHNNYKTIPNLDASLTRSIITRRLYAPHHFINTLDNKYQDFRYNKSRILSEIWKQAKYYIKKTRDDYTKVLHYKNEKESNYSNNKLREAFATIHTRHGAYDANRFRNGIDNDYISKETQEKMRDIAHNCSYLRQSSPYGHRNKIDFDYIESL